MKRGSFQNCHIVMGIPTVLSYPTSHIPYVSLLGVKHSSEYKANVQRRAQIHTIQQQSLWYNILNQGSERRFRNSLKLSMYSRVTLNVGSVGLCLPRAETPRMLMSIMPSYAGNEHSSYKRSTHMACDTKTRASME